MGWITTKLLGYVSGGLLLALIAMGVMLGLTASARDTAIAERDTARTERDAFKAAAENSALTVASHITAAVVDKASIGTLKGELARCNAINAEQARAGAVAAGRLESELADANAVLAEQADRFAAALRDPVCGICIDQPICPALLAR